MRNGDGADTCQLKSMCVFPLTPHGSVTAPTLRSPPEQIRGASRCNSAQQVVRDRKSGTETKIKHTLIVKIKYTVLTADHISLRYTLKTS
ncbi:hypothetical protein F2P81_001371 [Scophthalmus maximus]|uniref:Uncharacterized protein n=1 Tax=Scophthalmus maximus TaxID=52904 RepID=A0A6A4TTR3_SCOMX|nr:hypothetical protein F2P81_001371 [Scophthalmus maximus]